MRNSVNIPIFSIIEETEKKITSKKIGIICSETTNEMKLYKSNTVKIIYPNNSQQEILNNVIKNVISGKQTRTDSESIYKILKKFETSNVILGCTELPLAINQEDTNINLLNTLEILAEATVDFCKNNNFKKNDTKFNHSQKRFCNL